jgi:hypothetical protein
MITLEKVWNEAKALGDDAIVWQDAFDTVIFCLYVELNDFEGFDEDWSEIYREYDNPEAVERFKKMLENECIFKEGDLYVVYHFKDFDVQLGYSSFDI